MDTLEWKENTRPLWAYINPWLYMKRRDIAYAEALDSIKYANIECNKSVAELVTFLINSPAASDVCMCGDSMRDHDSPMNCGHVPVDIHSYYAEELIRKYKHHIESPNSAT